MLKLEQMELLVGAVIGMLEENLSEVNDPEKKEEMTKYKEQMIDLYERIVLTKILKPYGVSEMVPQKES